MTSISQLLSKSPRNWKIIEELPDEDVMLIEIPPPWKMFFDGSATQRGAGSGVVFITSDGDIYPYAFMLLEVSSNNMEEYQALILGLEMTIDIKVSRLKVYGDSQLVINQLQSAYEVRKPDLLPYHNYACNLVGWFSRITLNHISRKENAQVDALANLASTLSSLDK